MVGNIRPPTSGSRLLLTPFGFPTSRPGAVFTTYLVETARFACWVCVRGTAPCFAGTPHSLRSAPRSLTVRGSPPPSLRSSPARRLHIRVTFDYGICCGYLKYDTGPVSAALRPREPASLLCAIKRLSLLGGWINYLPHFQLRDPYSRFVDSSQHLIQIFVMLTCFSVDKLF